MDSGPLPGSNQSPRRARRALIVGAVLALLIAIACSVAFISPLRDSVQNLLEAGRIPKSVRSSVFIGSHGRTYRWSVIGLLPTKRPIVPASMLSPDGRSVVYAASLASSTSAIIHPAASVVYERDGILSGSSTPLTYGYAPEFLDATHVAYVTVGGIAVMDLRSHLSSLLFPRPSATSLQQVRYSPDRTLMLWRDAATGDTVVARIGLASYRPLHVFSGLSAPVVGNDAVYDVRPGVHGTALWRYPLDGSAPALMATLPSSLAITQIFP